ncbi:hypothetical protein SK128_000066 [Halocaridina rubra]|uniref:Glucosylceramidase n=1 Tax=Halocaridina rubra TaxID=373956 RepID=A0AAN9AFN6_HALRR
MILYFLFLLASSSAQAATDCIPRQFDHDSVVCVCNATYCDELGPVPWPVPGDYSIITSSRDGLRFHVEYKVPEIQATPDAIVVQVNHSYTRQAIMGFGGAFTDSTGMNIATLSSGAQENLLRAYFAPEGIEYNLCRIPIAGSDFSVRPYSYDDVEGDVDLDNWALAEEDLLYKLPMILRAQELSQNPIKLFGSPWSPPSWMKTNGKFNESGELLKEMWQPWANYFVKFVEAYEAAGATLWGLTTQNEPLSGFDDSWAWNTCGWTAADMRDWIKGNLGPTLEAAGMRRLKLMVDDYTRDTLPWYIMPMMNDANSSLYIDGTAVHWYSDNWVGPWVMDETQSLYLDKFLLYTESCAGFDHTGPYLGNWQRGEDYLHSILENSNHHSTGWVDWNMALDMIGGPNWAFNFVDSPIIINAEMDEFYKQPMFYAMGHFSKFVVEGALVADSSVVGSEALESAAFHHPSGPTIIVLLNTGEETLNVSITDGSEDFLNFQTPAKAFQTILYP